MKNMFLDLETTGIDKNQHAIIQLSGIIEIDGVEKEEFNFRLKPHPGAKIDPQALAVTGTQESDFENYDEPYLVFEQFIKLLEKYVSPYDKHDKFFFLAYNAPFDSEFLRSFFIRNEHKYFASYFWNPAIDVMVLAAHQMRDRRSELSNFKLITVCKAFGIEIDDTKLHDSLYDILITKQLYQKIENASSAQPVAQSTQEPLLENPEETEPPASFPDGLF